MVLTACPQAQYKLFGMLAARDTNHVVGTVVRIPTPTLPY